MKVKAAVEKKNRVRLEEECYKYEKGEKKVKTKTASILSDLKDKKYKRQPKEEVVNNNKQITRTIMLARYGMLECGTNYKQTLNSTCSECGVRDDENHRLNYCIKWKNTNFYNQHEKTNFEDIYSNQKEKLEKIIKNICQVWNIKCGSGSMRIDQ